jgi:hypothetical protein
LEGADPRHYTNADQVLADQIMVCAPQLPYGVRAHRSFLGRVVRHLVASGVRQFVDLGSGVPAAGNVHEIAQAIDPECRVVYVDIDPVVVAEGRAMLDGTANVGYAQADLRRPDQVLGSPEVRELLDLDQRVAVSLVDILHFVPNSDDPARIVRTYLNAVSAGSYLAVSHMGRDVGILAAMEMFGQMYGNPLPTLIFRGKQRIAELCIGLEPIAPGVVPVPLWRPDGTDTDNDRHPELFPDVAVVARKP